ncbi:MAG: HAD-IA family hydrolase [Lachnospiraceae bacterium]|nr:HAD-IA family hydrolase [Lachnospiraceae bacterium]
MTSRRGSTDRMLKNEGAPIKAVIFDLDDTLISEYQFIVSGYRYMAEYMTGRTGRTPKETEDKLWELSKTSYANVFNRLFDEWGIPYSDADIKELVAVYRDHPARLTFYPDVLPALQGIKDKGIPMGIISDGDPGRQRNKLKTVDGDRWFDHVILTDEFGGARYRKPDPRGFVTMTELMGVDASQMIYVGDNPAKDFHIAQDMPVRTARITRENGIYNDREYLDGIRETWSIDSLVDIIQLL